MLTISAFDALSAPLDESDSCVPADPRRSGLCGKRSVPTTTVVDVVEICTVELKLFKTLVDLVVKVT